MQKSYLVMLPGLDGTGKLFKRAIGYLPAFIEPLVVSYPPTEKLGYRELVPVVIASLPTDTPFFIVGESFGGPLALLVADRQPAGLRGIVLSASFIKCPHSWVPSMAGNFIPRSPFRLMAPLSKITGSKGGYWTEESHRALSSVSPEVWVHRLREILQVDVSAELARNIQPLLYIQGTRDKVVPAANIKKIVSIRSDTKLVALDCNHMVLQTKPQQAAAAITGFIEELPT